LRKHISTCSPLLILILLVFIVVTS
jgi:hypothetical protein